MLENIQLKSVRGSAVLLRFSLNVNTFIKIKSHTKFVRCLFLLNMYISMAFVPLKKKISIGC